MLLYLLLSLIGSTYSTSCDHHARTNMLPDRSTIVHLFEWKWADIADECERFLAPKGYGGVQISPPSENLIIHLSDGSRPWYERYQPISYILKTRSGDEREFLDMTTRCNRVGVRIYADVVINHMTGDNPNNVGTAGSTADLQNYSYPAVPYRREHFHVPKCGVDDYNNASQVRDCELLGLKDLDHNMPYVREKITEYLNNLIHLGVAGFRVDAAKHMWPDSLKAIYDNLNCLNTDFGFCPSTKPYIYQEVIYHRDGAIKPDEYTSFGDVTEFRVGTELKTVFRGKNPLKWLVNWGEQWDLSPSETALVFIDNHDTQRQSDVLTYKEAKAYKGATAFLLAHPYGEPKIMSSYFFKNGNQGPPVGHNETLLSPSINQDDTCGNGWICEHRWRQIYQMVGFRNAVRGTNVSNWWDNGNNQMAFSRGDKAFVVFNLEKADLVQSLQTGIPAGKYCDIITGKRKGDSCTGRVVTVDKDGKAHITISANAEDMHLAIHVGKESSLQSSLQTPETTNCVSSSDINQQDQTSDRKSDRTDTGRNILSSSNYKLSNKPSESSCGTAEQLILAEKIIPGEDECPCSVSFTSGIGCRPKSCELSSSEGCKTSGQLHDQKEELQDGSDYDSLSAGRQGIRRTNSPNTGLQSHGQRSPRSNSGSNDGSNNNRPTYGGTDESYEPSDESDSWSNNGSPSDSGSNKKLGKSRGNNGNTPKRKSRHQYPSRTIDDGSSEGSQDRWSDNGSPSDVTQGLNRPDDKPSDNTRQNSLPNGENQGQRLSRPSGSNEEGSTEEMPESPEYGSKNDESRGSVGNGNGDDLTDDSSSHQQSNVPSDGSQSIRPSESSTNKKDGVQSDTINASATDENGGSQSALDGSPNRESQRPNRHSSRVQNVSPPKVAVDKPNSTENDGSEIDSGSKSNTASNPKSKNTENKLFNKPPGTTPEELQSSKADMNGLEDGLPNESVYENDKSSREKSSNGDSQGSNRLPSSNVPNESNDNAKDKFQSNRQSDGPKKGQDDNMLSSESEKPLDILDNGSSTDNLKSEFNGPQDGSHNKESEKNNGNSESLDNKNEKNHESSNNEPGEISENSESLNRRNRKGLRYYLNKIKDVILQRS